MASHRRDGGQSGPALLGEEVDDAAVPDAEAVSAEGHAEDRAKGKGVLLPSSSIAGEEGGSSGPREVPVVLVPENPTAEESDADNGTSRQTAGVSAAAPSPPTPAAPAPSPTRSAPAAPSPPPESFAPPTSPDLPALPALPAVQEPPTAPELPSAPDSLLPPDTSTPLPHAMPAAEPPSPLLSSLRLPPPTPTPPASTLHRGSDLTATGSSVQTRHRTRSRSPSLSPPPPPPPPHPPAAAPRQSVAQTLPPPPRPRAVSEWVPSPRQELASVVPPPLRDSPQDFSLPRWQPDAEVTLCPICRAQFSIFVRKHHCRKCGRVVCNSCSPHRITIPYQYIVHPPGHYSSRTQAAAAAFLGDSGNVGLVSSLVDVTTLGGGERVRLCNPCVPDPNTAPPHTPRLSGLASASTSAGPQTRNHFRTVSSVSGPGGSGGSGGGGPMFSAFLGPPGAGGQPASSASNALLTAPPASSQHHHRLSLPPSSAPGTSSESQMQLMAQQQRRTQRSGRSDPIARQQMRQQQRQMRPQPLAEEDECPVCHLELPSRQLPNFEEQREQHIMDCLESHSGSHHGRRRTVSNSGSGIGSGSGSGSGSVTGTGPGPGTGTGTGTGTAPGSGSSGGSSSSDSNDSSAHMQRLRSHPWRTGMFPYLATEKDCVDAAECTICLEEFEVGVPMARLECLCRFHRACIQAWFEKHPGRCPVHNHDSSDY